MNSFPLAPTSPAGKFRGVFLGTVEENKDDPPNNPGFRIRVTVDTLGEGIRTFWARVVIPMGGKDRGTYFLPQKGEQVLVVFEHGNMNRTPIILGTMWSSKGKPPETNASGNNNTKLIRTPKGHRIIFDDKEGAEKLTIVDRTGNNKIQIDSAAKKVTIQSHGDLEIIAKNDAIFHAKRLNLNANAQLTQDGMNVGIHAMGPMSLFGQGTVTGSIQIGMNPTPACKIVVAPVGALGGSTSDSDSDSKAAEQAQKDREAAASKQGAPNAQGLNEQESKAREAANEPVLSNAVASAIGISGVAGMMIGGSALNDDGFGGFGGGPGGAAGLGTGGVGGLGGGGGLEEGAPTAGSPSAFADENAVAAADPTSGDRPESNRLSAGAVRSEDPQWKTGRTGRSAGGVGHDVRGRASASADVSASGVDFSSSSSSSVFQEAAVSRATNPAQVPDAAVRVSSEVDKLVTSADPVSEASSHVRPLPLEPTPPVVEPRTVAAAAAPDSVRSAVDTVGRAESSTSDVRAYMKDPEQGAEAAARSMVNERISAAHPMGAKGELNARESTYGDPNMLAKAEVDHQFDRAEAAQKVAVADEHRSADLSVSTEQGEGDVPKAAKLPVEFENLEAKKADPKKPGGTSDPKKPGSK